MNYLIRIDKKRFVRNLKKVILVYIVAILMATITFIYIKKFTKEMTDNYNIAIVNEDNSILGNICINLISSNGISDYINNFDILDSNNEEEAINIIKSGKYLLSGVLPKGYIDTIRRGEDTTIKMYVNDKYPLVYEIITRIINYSKKMFYAGECGVFAGENLLKNITNDEYNNYIKDSNLNIINFSLKNQSKIFKNQILPYSKTNILYIPFLVISFIIFIIMFGNILNFNFYKNDIKKSLLIRIKQENVKDIEILIGKLLLPVIPSVIITIVVLFISNVFLNNKIYINVVNIIYIVLSLFMLNMFTFLISLYTDKKYNFSFIIIILTIIFLLLNGTIVPRYMISANILQIIDLTPFGICFSLLSSVFAENGNKINYIILFLYIIISILLIKMRMVKIIKAV